MSTYLVCEGSTDGLDIRVLNLVIVQKLGRDVLLEPAGGDSSLGSVAEYLRQRYGARAYTIEDRNFRPQEKAEETWQQTGQTQWIWRRHEIENYLLDPRLIAAAFQSLQNARVPGAANLPTDAQSIFTALQKLARPMLERHAGWLTYWQLNAWKNTPANDVRWLKPKDALPAGSPLPGPRQEWLDYLCSECRRLKQACKHLVDDTTFDESNIIRYYDDALGRVSASEFLNSGRFLWDLEGKELLSSLMTFINRQGLSQLSRSDFETELLDALDRLYTPGFFEPDDFAQLAERLP